MIWLIPSAFTQLPIFSYTYTYHYKYTHSYLYTNINTIPNSRHTQVDHRVHRRLSRLSDKFTAEKIRKLSGGEAKDLVSCTQYTLHHIPYNVHHAPHSPPPLL
ncbi:hypothetical protein EON63_25020 [archaeon]|nr:MAG: hypothetical protein EON63_25020 [archaeon]